MVKLIIPVLQKKSADKQKYSDKAMTFLDNLKSAYKSLADELNERATITPVLQAIILNYLHIDPCEITEEQVTSVMLAGSDSLTIEVVE